MRRRWRTGGPVLGATRPRNPHTSTPVHYAVPLPVDLTPDYERRRAMAERLHKVWHAAPCASPSHIRCDLLTRAHAVVLALEPLLDQYLVEAVERARADLRREWGE